MAKEKLTAIPKPKKQRRDGARQKASGGGTAADSTPDLSHIAPDLRPHAVRCEELAFMVGNPRAHPEDNIEGIAASLREFGQLELLVVNKRKHPAEVIGGNGRLQAALMLGWQWIAVHFVDVDEKQAKLIAVALNRTGETAGWDKAALEKVLAEVTPTDEQLKKMIAELATEQLVIPNGSPEDGEDLQLKPPPAIVWILCGIPLDHYHQAAVHVAALEGISSVSVQSSRDKDG